MWHSSGRLAADGDQFGGNGYGDFFGRDGSDIETDRSMHAVEKMGRDALLLERLENLNNAWSRSCRHSGHEFERPTGGYAYRLDDRG